jgi:hypothetical protein
MPSPNNWALIRTGETFQSLVNTLLQFEHPGTHVFGRAGKDGGQDARSADDRIVYQYKYHDKASFAKAIADAKKELVKISAYRQSGSDRYDQWKDAQEWVLVTNVEINPNDNASWNEDVVPKFAAIGLKAIFWGIEALDALLTKYPHVKEAYFEGQNRCFLSLGEAYEFTKADELGDAGLKVAFVGRNSQLDAIDAFIKGTKKLLFIHGSGGIGKSRLLLEIGNRAEKAGKQVLWGLEATMCNSQQWFSTIPYTLPTLLILDEPQDPDLVNVLAEQIKLSNGQMQDWKVIIAVRSPNDPVLKALSSVSGGIREEPIALEPLTHDQAKELARGLIETTNLAALTGEQKETISEDLSRLGDRYPIWIAMAINVLAKHGHLHSLSTDRDEIATKYLDEIIQKSTTPTCSQAQLRETLCWLALYEELDVEEFSLVAFVSKKAGFTEAARFIECLNSLVTRRFVVRRGMNRRLYSIKPDVMRDFIVQTWLIWAPDGTAEPTPAAQALMGLMVGGYDNKPLPRLHAIVRGLARTEYLTQVQGKKLNFLSPLVAELTRLAKDGTVLDQQGVIWFLNCFDFARLNDVLDLIKTLLLNEKPAVAIKDFFEHSHELTHQEIVTQLAWPLFNAARFAQTSDDRRAIIEQFAVLSIYQAKIQSLPGNDGKRADALIPRVISGENNWYSGYSNEAFSKATALIMQLKGPTDMDEPTLNLTQVFCDPFLSVERERMSFARHTFTSHRWFIRLKSEDGQKRDLLRAELRQCLRADRASEKCRLLCWKLLANAHSSANRSLRGENKSIPMEVVSEIKDDLKADLAWTLETLSTAKLQLPEMKAARNMWEWHIRFEKDEEIKALALNCEKIYQQDPLVSALHVFFSYELYEEAAKKVKELGNKLGETGTCNEIRQFLKQAQEFAPQREKWGNILEVANNAGSYWDTNKELSEFVKQALAGSTGGIEFVFGTSLLNRRLKFLRESNATEVLRAELNGAAAITSSPTAKAQVLSNLYERPHPLITGILTTTDLDFIASQLAALPEFVDPGKQCLFLSGAAHANWQSCKVFVEGVYNASSGTARLHCYLGSLRGLYFLDLFRRDYPALAITAEHYDWLLGLMVRLSDLDLLEHESEFVQLSERFERKAISWLFVTVQARIDEAQSLAPDDPIEYKIIPTRNRLTRYVATLTAADAASPAIKQAFEAFLNYSERTDVVGYILPRYAAELDPNGLMVPDLLRTHLLSVGGNKEGIWTWSQFAGYYPFNSNAWRTIAIAASEAAKGLPERDRQSVYVNLLPQEGKSSSFPAGQMNPLPAAELQCRKREFDEENDVALAPFRQWHLAVAQANYDQTVARFREENEQ